MADQHPTLTPLVPREPRRGAGAPIRARRGGGRSIRVRHGGGGANRVRHAAAALLAALVLPLAACSVFPLGQGEEPTTPPERTPSAATTDGPAGDPDDYAATCTGEGRLQTHGSTQGTDHESQNAQGESFRYAVVMIQADDGGEPSAELRLQLPGAGSEDLPGLRVGDTAEFDDWTLTIRSICADEVGFDAEITD